MSVQMTIRLPDDVAAFVDRQVEQGEAASRAAAIATALRHERRRRAAERDAAIYAAEHGEDDPDDLAGLVAYTAAHRPDLDA